MGKKLSKRYRGRTVRITQNNTQVSGVGRNAILKKTGKMNSKTVMITKGDEDLGKKGFCMW